MKFKNEVFSMWIGSKLSALEQTCINSFLENDTAFILYIYDDIENVPEGTIIKDGNTVVPFSKYIEYDNPSYFSNLFRYKRLYELGGLWVDMDLVCIKSIKQLISSSEYIFSSELKNHEQHTNAGFIGCPPKTSVMLECINEVKNIKKSTTNIRHGQLGPKVLKRFVASHELDHYVYPHYVFCPFGFREVKKIFTTNFTHKSLEDTICIHLWNNVLSKEGINKEIPNEETLYYELVSKYIPKKTTNVLFKNYVNKEDLVLNTRENNICLAYCETEAYFLKNENPSSKIILVKKSFNSFLVDCNNLNTHVYEYVDKIVLDKSIHETHIKFNILKTLLKK
tara:strand:- start:784 stop:1797 length:1014 start_codon:yes stop_codon:yes gene_type:complete